MAVTLEDLAARVEELAQEKASSEQRVAALEQELVALRAALASRPLEVPDAPGTHASSVQPVDEAQIKPDAVRRMLPRPITRLGLIGAAAAAGAYAVMPPPAHAETEVSPRAPITSPNGLFSLNVTDLGIFLTGPGGRIEVLGAQVIIKGVAAAKIQAPTVQVTGSGVLNLNGATVTLNGGGHPVARVGDTVTVPGVGVGTISTGAPAVFA